MNHKQKVFNGLLVGYDAVDTPPEYSPSLSNVDTFTKGALKNIKGIEKYNSVNFGNPIVAIHQLNGHIFSLSGSKLYEGDPTPSWTTLGGFASPRGIYYDSASEFIYVVHGGDSGQITKTKIDGTDRIDYYEASGEGRLRYPCGIDYDPATEFIYVADYDNHRIVKTKIDGTGFVSLGSEGSGEGQFLNPSDVYYDPATEYLYIADRRNYRVVKTKIDGTGWTTYGSSGYGVGKFSGFLDGLYYDPVSEFIYVMAGFEGSTYNKELIKTKLDGSWTGWTTLGGFLASHCLHYDPASEFIYTTQGGDYAIIKTKIDGTGWVTYGTDGSGVGQFFHPYGIFYDSNTKEIYVTGNNNRIVKTNAGWA